MLKRGFFICGFKAILCSADHLQGRCKVPGCAGTPRAKGQKPDVHLCFTSPDNCFHTGKEMCSLSLIQRPTQTQTQTHTESIGCWIYVILWILYVQF